ncbi:class I SAM-dependent methyltransferase [Aliamphritea hakodatensis]|uniref:class I SAM-dependent methyltransferase n=1 Tax=Aliamphritea hakodatensis TaxID=2895352 RepID=UPI0022FD5843|nr:class I SAM-dependent methyltransferase [Aliamphritea hakodatensis]
MQAVFDYIEQQFGRRPGEVSRLFHGRGCCFSGFENVVIDRLPPLIVIRLFNEIPADQLERLVAFFAEHPVHRPATLLVQHRYRREDSIQVCWQADDADIHRLAVTEGSLKFWMQPLKNQNNGLFLDMREGRRWVQQHAEGARVLNLFAYTCGFSVAALAGGAEKVVNLDMSSPALNTGRENHRLNDHDLSRVKFFAHDLFRSWGKLKREGPYDLVVIDPPSFQKGSFVATKDYLKVLRRLPELTTDHAKVLSCLNSPELESQFLRDLMAEHCPQFSFVERLANPDDFPDADPERALKVLVFEKLA